MWNDKQVQRLKQLWKDGLSAAQIACELGGVSRNAVIGKAHRLGLEGRPRPAGAENPRRPRPPKALRKPRATVRSRVSAALAALASEASGQRGLSIVRAPGTRPEPGSSARAAAPAPIAAVVQAAAPKPAPDVIPFGQRCSLLELRAESCRWPVGDPATPGFFFCGGEAIAGVPYCGWHARLAYRLLRAAG